MGGSQSRTEVSQLIAVSSTVFEKVSRSHQTTGIATQVINIEGKGDIVIEEINMEQKVFVSVSNMTSSSTIQEMKSEMKSEIENFMKNNQEMFSILSRSDQKFKVEMENYINVMTSKETIENIINVANALQYLNIQGEGDIEIDEVNMDQTIEIIAEAFIESSVDVLADAGIEADVKTAMESRQTIAADTIGAIGDAVGKFFTGIMAGGILGLMLPLLFIVLIIITIVVVVKFAKGDFDGDDEREDKDRAWKEKILESQRISAQQQYTPQPPPQPPAYLESPFDNSSYRSEAYPPPPIYTTSDPNLFTPLGQPPSQPGPPPAYTTQYSESPF